LFRHIFLMPESALKPVDWIGSSYRDFRAFPDEVQDHMGYALHLAQTGEKHDDAKPLKGFGGAGVLEIVSDHVGDTYRAVYTVKFAAAVYVLHAFQKKSKTGSKAPPADMELVERRLKAAEADYKARLAKGKKS
jgi:phage-related protein